MNTAVKHTSISKARTKIDRAREKVLQLTGMNDDDLFEMKLAIGMQFAEQVSKTFISGRQRIYRNLVENPQWNFWNWWNMKWAFDDAALLQMGVLNEQEHIPYRQLKEAMLGEELLIRDLYWLIQQYTDEV